MLGSAQHSNNFWTIFGQIAPWVDDTGSCDCAASHRGWSAPIRPRRSRVALDGRCSIAPPTSRSTRRPIPLRTKASRVQSCAGWRRDHAGPLPSSVPTAPSGARGHPCNYKGPEVDEICVNWTAHHVERALSSGGESAEPCRSITPDCEELIVRIQMNCVRAGQRRMLHGSPPAPFLGHRRPELRSAHLALLRPGQWPGRRDHEVSGAIQRSSCPP